MWWWCGGAVEEGLGELGRVELGVEKQRNGVGGECDPPFQMVSRNACYPRTCADAADAQILTFRTIATHMSSTTQITWSKSLGFKSECWYSRATCQTLDSSQHIGSPYTPPHRAHIAPH